MKRAGFIAGLVGLLSCAAPKATPAPAGPLLPPAPPVLEGLGDLKRPVSHASPEAQRWFNQGLSLVYGFNHDEALRAFAYAAAVSPQCAMCFWGVAYSNGPHINNPVVTPEQAKVATQASRKAQALASEATAVEQALIAALAKRYVEPQPEDRRPLDIAYAEAMRGVRQAFPGDADVVALTAEALMTLHPWDYYTLEGAPLEWTPEIVDVTAAALALNPRHPLANHVYIHAVEASREPARAQAAADRLRDLQPGLGHMVHMPSHIDVRTGQWEKAIVANQRAIEADARYQKLVPRQGFYAVYMAHNHHMLAYAAMMTGRSAVALSMIQALVDGIPPEFRKEAAPLVDGMYALPLEVQMRFGKWDEILAAPDFGEDLPASRALRHAARSIAFAAKGDVPSARQAQQAFEAARKLVPHEHVMGLNPMSALNDLVSHLVEGELLYREKKQDLGLAELRRAVELEDRLRYSEPPDWIQPTRHALGAALTQSKKYPEAEAVFREDLRRQPNNGWALFGLARALKLQGKAAEAAKMEKQFNEVWKHADLKLNSACLCQPGV